MHTFFLYGESLQEGKGLFLPPDDVNHAYRVLRLRTGDEVVLSDGRGKAHLAVIVDSGPQKVALRVGGETASLESFLQISLYQALAKGDRFDLVVRQAVELGVQAITPVATARSVPRLDSRREEKRLQRWRSIARSSAAQCRRSLLPKINPVRSIESVKGAFRNTTTFVPWECEENTSLYKSLKQPVPRDKAVSIFIGPEGGFSDKEIEALQEAGAIPVSLGPRIMRVDTAAAAAITMVQAAWGDLSPEGD